MAVTFNRRPGLKYTTMAIYIDEHMHEVVNVGEHPDVESTIFEYLYHIIYALSYKAMFFKKFEDYDTFALVSASQLYISMLKKWKNKGQIVRGKEVVPVKSCLNFIKSVLFPLKINYQKDNFVDILNPELNQDTSVLTEDIRNNIQTQYRGSLESSLEDLIKSLPNLAWKVILNTPYKKNKLLCKKLYLSCILSLINNICLSNKKKNKLAKKIKRDVVDTNTMLSLYQDKNDNDEVLLWHLDETFHDYVLLLTRKIKQLTSKELEDNIHAFDLDENIIDFIMNSSLSPSEDDTNI